MNTILSFNINLGDLTELKANKLKETLQTDFKNVVVMPNQIVMNGEDAQIVLNTFQIQYTFAHEYLDKIQANLIKIQETLMLDSIINNTVVILAELKNIEKDSLAYTKEMFNNLISNSIGVGKREFFKYEDNLCEIRIEPYIKESSNMYIEARYILGKKNINGIADVLSKVKADYNRKKEEINSNLK